MGQERASVLVVDDDIEIRRTIADVLEDEGYRVDLAENGQDALALIDRDHPPRVILLDLMMPVMDGWSVLAALRADERLAAIPVVIISVFCGRAPAPALSVREVMDKPLTIERLLAVVSRCAA